MKNTKMLSNTEISSFCEQIALILNAGITPVEGMGILVSDTKNAEGRIIIQSIWNVCKAGESFYTAVKSSGVFPDYVLHMISIEIGRAHV